MTLRPKIVVLVIVIAVSIPVAYFGIGAYQVFVAPSVENASMQIPFDSKKWKANSEDAGVMWPTRLRMADDLIRSRILLGKTKAEVAQWLGPHDSFDFSSKDPEYLLGPQRGLIRMDGEFLTLAIDKRGRVSRVSITTY